MHSIPGLRRSPGEGNGNPLQYSCLENPTDRGAWWPTVHQVAELEMTEQMSTQWARASIVTRANSLNLFFYPSVMLQSMGLQRVGYDWATKLNGSIYHLFLYVYSIYPPSSTYLFVSILFINLSCTYFFISILSIHVPSICLFISVLPVYCLSIICLSVTYLLALFPWRTSANTTIEDISSTQNFLVDRHHPLTPSLFFRSIWL